MSLKGQITTADYLSMEELYRLLEELHNRKLYLWELYCCVQFCTALRISDVLTTQWEQLYEEYYDKTEQKTSKTREIYLNETVRLHIDNLYRLLGCPDKKQLVFYNAREKKAYSKQYINKVLKKFKTEFNLNIHRISSHTFRKTLGRYMYDIWGANNDALLKVQKLYNHKSPDITVRYLGISRDEVMDFYKKINLQQHPKQETLNEEQIKTLLKSVISKIGLIDNFTLHQIHKSNDTIISAHISYTWFLNGIPHDENHPNYLIYKKNDEWKSF